jgi:4-carboxymuconolactone decarboxylase
MLTREQAEVFRRLSIGDPATLRQVMGARDDAPGMLGQRWACLVRLGGMILLGPSQPAFEHEVRGALDAGASPEEIIAVLVAMAPVAGGALVTSAAPKVAMALGYDVDAALEGSEI